jgi:hypothetical protein
VSAARIEAICKAKVRLNPDSVLDPEAPQGLHSAVRQLQRLQVGPCLPASASRRISSDSGLFLAVRLSALH